MAKKAPREMSMADAVSEAFGEITSLGEEMREAFDNTPESLQESGVGAARGEAADALESIDELELPDWVGGLPVKFSDVHVGGGRRGLSRNKRRDNAVNILENVMSALEELEEKTEGEEKKTELSELRDELETRKDEMEAVEFPGMFG